MVRIRADLREQMRAAMLRAGDPGQLGRWLATPEGREDAELWAVYRAALDPGSTAFARASARIAVLDRELGS